MRLITNLLDISKSEEGQLVPRKLGLDWRALVAEVFEEFGVTAHARKITLESVTAADSLRADYELLKRVLENLLDNAIRHAPPGSAVRISDRQVEGEFEIRVADAGAGIPADQREKIFDRFVQIDSASVLGARSGRGLGLTFCKLAIEAHGGRIWVEDAAPGTVFCIRLPHEP